MEAVAEVVAVAASGGGMHAASPLPPLPVDGSSSDAVAPHTPAALPSPTVVEDSDDGPATPTAAAAAAASALAAAPKGSKRLARLLIAVCVLLGMLLPAALAFGDAFGVPAESPLGRGVAAARQHMAREPKINAARAEEEDDELRWRRRRQASSDSKKEAATGAKPKAASAKPTAAADEELQRARRAAEAKAARARATPPEDL